MAITESRWNDVAGAVGAVFIPRLPFRVYFKSAHYLLVTPPTFIC